MNTWKMWASKSEGDILSPVGTQPYVEIHYLGDPIVPVTVKEVTKEDDYASHWGWIDADETVPAMTLIWPSRVQFDMCFPYGPQVAVDGGRGRIVRLHITEDASD